LVDSCSRWGKRRGGNEFQTCVTDKLSGQPKERLLKVIIGLGGDIVVLEVLLSVECDSLGLHLSLLNIDLVASKNDGNVLANTDQVAMPVGNVFVGDTGGDVKHDDTALAIDVVSVTKTSKFFSCPAVSQTSNWMLPKFVEKPKG